MQGEDVPVAGEEVRRGWLRRVALTADKVVEGCAIGMLVSMVLIVFVQVITRKLFSFVFFWSEEITLLCLTWFSFMGIAIGFREGLHLAMDLVSNILPKRVNLVLDKIIEVTIFAFGIYLVVWGWEFTQLMSESTLPATKLPNSVQYLVVPITGLLTCVYSTLHLFGMDTRRYQHIDEEIKRDDA